VLNLLTQDATVFPIYACQDSAQEVRILRQRLKIEHPKPDQPPFTRHRLEDFGALQYDFFAYGRKSSSHGDEVDKNRALSRATHTVDEDHRGKVMGRVVERSAFTIHPNRAGRLSSRLQEFTRSGEGVLLALKEFFERSKVLFPPKSCFHFSPF
jgi:hypothetical protein